MTDAVATRIAARGHEALLADLRHLYTGAAEAHADIIAITDERLEELVAGAGQRADGAQWRCALATVGADELQISFAQALSHPAVAAAQALAQAPPYELELDARDTGATDIPDTDIPDGDIPDTDIPDGDIPDSDIPDGTAAGDELLLDAIHIGGVADLAVGRDEIGLLLAAPGLDIIGADGEPVGRLPWDEIDDLEVRPARGLLRRRTRHTQLHVRTGHGDAGFEVPSLTADELRERLAPLIDRFGRR